MFIEVERFFEFDDCHFLSCSDARKHVRKNSVNEIILFVRSEQAKLYGFDFEYARKSAVLVYDTTSVYPLIRNDALDVCRVLALFGVFFSAENMSYQVKSAFVNALLTDRNKQRNKQTGNSHCDKQAVR